MGPRVVSARKKNVILVVRASDTPKEDRNSHVIAFWAVFTQFLSDRVEICTIGMSTAVAVSSQGPNLQNPEIFSSIFS